jgi:hypothetical protein
MRLSAHGSSSSGIENQVSQSGRTFTQGINPRFVSSLSGSMYNYGLVAHASSYHKFPIPAAHLILYFTTTWKRVWKSFVMSDHNNFLVDR